MKISSLTIIDFRGIRHLTIPLESRSAVIWDDNGVGKSGVVDAVDFLLRGDVTRLSGRGAGGLSLLQHGPHVRAKTEHARVDAEVILDDGATYQVSRSVSQPNALVADPAVSPEFLRVSGRGQHLLTRRDILSVVTVPPGDRGADSGACGRSYGAPKSGFLERRDCVDGRRRDRLRRNGRDAVGLHGVDGTHART